MPMAVMQQAGFPIAEVKPYSFGIFAKEQENDEQRNDEIENDAIPVFVGGQLVIVIHHQQQGRDDGDGDDFPVKV